MPSPAALTVNGQGAQWVVLRVDEAGPIMFADPSGGPDLAALDLTGHPPPAALLSLPAANALQASLGPPWIVNHGVTLVPAAQHQQWLNRQGLRWAL